MDISVKLQTHFVLNINGYRCCVQTVQFYWTISFQQSRTSKTPADCPICANPFQVHLFWDKVFEYIIFHSFIVSVIIGKNKNYEYTDNKK